MKLGLFLDSPQFSRTFTHKVARVTYANWLNCLTRVNVHNALFKCDSTMNLRSYSCRDSDIARSCKVIAPVVLAVTMDEGDEVGAAYILCAN